MSEPTTIKAVLPDFLTATSEELDDKRDYKPRRYELNFVTEGLAPCVNEAHREIQWYLNDALEGVQKRVRWVTLHGSPGCGKTHLIRAASAILRANGKESQTWNWKTLFNWLMDSDSYPGLWRQVVHMPFLGLDDILTGYLASDKASGLQSSILYDLLEERLGKWTLITSNIAPENMPDVRLTSRLFRGNNVVVDMQGADDYAVLRYKQKKNNEKKSKETKGNDELTKAITRNLEKEAR